MTYYIMPTRSFISLKQVITVIALKRAFLRDAQHNILSGQLGKNTIDRT